MTNKLFAVITPSQATEACKYTKLVIYLLLYVKLVFSIMYKFIIIFF